MALLLGLVAIGCVEVLRPFFSAILWAAILVFSTWPIFLRARRRLRLGRTGAAALMVFGEAVLLLLPLAAAVPGGAADVEQLRSLAQRVLQAGLPPAPGWVWDVPILGARIGEVWNSWSADLSAMGDFLRPYLGAVAQFALSLVLGLADGLLQVVLALVIAFFFYASGDRLARVVTALLVRITGARAERLIAVTGATVRGVVYGLIGTAVVQGLLTALGLCCWARSRAACRCCRSARRPCGSPPPSGCSPTAIPGRRCCWAPTAWCSSAAPTTSFVPILSREVLSCPSC
jgi:predicted PurR-regulated permease PerM